MTSPTSKDLFPIQLQLNEALASLNMLSLNFQSENGDCIFNDQTVLNAISAIHRQVENANLELSKIETQSIIGDTIK